MTTLDTAAMRELARDDRYPPEMQAALEIALTAYNRERAARLLLGAEVARLRADLDAAAARAESWHRVAASREED